MDMEVKIERGYGEKELIHCWWQSKFVIHYDERFGESLKD